MVNLKSFEELGNVVKVPETEESKKISKLLKEQFHRIRSGHFQSSLAGVDSLIFTAVGNAEQKSVNITINYNGEDDRFLLTLFNDGTLSGQVPSSCKATKDDIKKEIFRILETINLEFWHSTDVVILPEKDSKEETEGDKEEERMGNRDNGMRPERLQFVAKQRGALFGFVGREGFDGYQASIFYQQQGKKLFLILENERYGNAAYIVDIPNTPLPEDKLNSDQFPELTDTEVNDLAHLIWDPIGERAKTRKELREFFKATRVLHAGDWETRMQREINTRLTS